MADTPMTDTPTTWTDAVSGFLGIFDRAVAQNRSAVWNPVGAQACSELVREMARHLDEVAPASLEEHRMIIEDLLAKNTALYETGKKAAGHIRRMQGEREALRAAIRALGGDPDDLPPGQEASKAG